MAVELTIGPAHIGHQERRIPLSMNARLHWAARYRWSKAWKECVAIAIWENKRKFGRLPMRKAHIVVTLHTMKLLDTDNAYASVKPVVDGLKEYGVIEDDRPELLELVVKQDKVKHRVEEKVSLTIEKIADEQPRLISNDKRSTAA